MRRRRRRRIEGRRRNEKWSDLYVLTGFWMKWCCPLLATIGRFPDGTHKGLPKTRHDDDDHEDDNDDDDDYDEDEDDDIGNTEQQDYPDDEDDDDRHNIGSKKMADF